MGQLVDFPQVRQAPADLLRRLQEIDRTATLVYAGEGRWLLGRVKPNSDRRKIAEDILARATNLPAGAKLNARSRERVRLALLALQGFGVVDEYVIQGEPDGRIVEDFRRALYLLERATEASFFADLDAPAEAAKAAARADLTDPARAADAWRYAFTLNHSVSRLYDPTKPVYKSGRTRHSIPA